MIKQVVVNGCSFTRGDPHGHSWADYINQPVMNIANGAAGNSYICQRTVNYLETHQPDPATTLLIVMWSGTSRIDVPVSSDWYQHIKCSHSYGYSDGITNWIHTGSSGHVPLLENLCKVNDNTSLCVASLQNFIMLGSYLSAKKYRYLFCSYANYWQESQEYCATTKVDPCIGYHCQHLKLYQDFDFTNWFFVNHNRDSFGEFAIQDISTLSHAHPSAETHKNFAQNIVIPAINLIQ